MSHFRGCCIYYLSCGSHDQPGFRSSDHEYPGGRRAGRTVTVTVRVRPSPRGDPAVWQFSQPLCSLVLFKYFTEPQKPGPEALRLAESRWPDQQPRDSTAGAATQVQPQPGPPGQMTHHVRLRAG
eukprot:198186-Hanusia_phi.AAC.1